MSFAPFCKSHGIKGVAGLPDSIPAYSLFSITILSGSGSAQVILSTGCADIWRNFHVELSVWIWLVICYMLEFKRSGIFYFLTSHILVYETFFIRSKNANEKWTFVFGYDIMSKNTEGAICMERKISGRLLKWKGKKTENHCL